MPTLQQFFFTSATAFPNQGPSHCVCPGTQEVAHSHKSQTSHTTIERILQFNMSVSSACLPELNSNFNASRLSPTPSARQHLPVPQPATRGDSSTMSNSSSAASRGGGGGGSGCVVSKMAAGSRVPLKSTSPTPTADAASAARATSPRAAANRKKPLETGPASPRDFGGSSGSSGMKGFGGGGGGALKPKTVSHPTIWLPSVATPHVALPLGPSHTYRYVTTPQHHHDRLPHVALTSNFPSQGTAQQQQGNGGGEEAIFYKKPLFCPHLFSSLFLFPLPCAMPTSPHADIRPLMLHPSSCALHT